MKEAFHEPIPLAAVVDTVMDALRFLLVRKYQMARTGNRMSKPKK